MTINRDVHLNTKLPSKQTLKVNGKGERERCSGRGHRRGGNKVALHDMITNRTCECDIKGHTLCNDLTDLKLN